MYNVRKVTDKITWIGGEDRRLALFESAYPIPNGVSYNSYFVDDEKTVVLDTVDRSVADRYFENLEHMLAGRTPDYLIVNHMEPDHAATVSEFVRRYPDAVIVCNAKIEAMLKQYFDFDTEGRCSIVNEGDTLCTGEMTFTFVFAPMVHWPEVMMTYEVTNKILFSADAFGTFGSLNGAIFADQVDFWHDYIDDARRYYTNIVGKYGAPVMGVLKKASSIEINMICPLHGFVWRRDIGSILDKYVKWASYQPEEKGVLIGYASVYGNTANAADILATKLVEKGIKVRVYDISATHASYVVADAFRFSHIVLACPTYNAGIFISMENLVHDIANHGLQNRRIALMENGSWSPIAARQVKAILESLKGTEFIGTPVSIRSAVKTAQLEAIEQLAEEIAASMQ